ncbi:NEDD4 family-interacting protein 2-like [Argopecten irradians]|uniref:NEDD4 family-interacting protein 2-like n=1 Tax=Argopecten irradians TaxID=31199 RepID=UPI0037201677
MDRPIRYQVLTSEEDDVPAQPLAVAMVLPPVEQPPAPSSEEPEHMYGTKLPTYDEATTLPTYEEAERSKAAEAERQQDVESQNQEDMEHSRHMLRVTSLGTDGMFLCAFVVAFFFNWIGFLFSICVFTTIAGRCGALSGLGLSIVKWVAIVKQNDWASGYAESDSWIWWLLILCGFMIFLRGAIHYAKIKYEWNRLAHNIRSQYFFTL